MHKKILILGTGGNCIDILETIDEINRSTPAYQCLGFLDDDEQRWGREYQGVKVLGPLQSARQYEDCYFVNGIGSPANFWKKEAILASTGIGDDRFETVIHPTASVSRSARLGPGTVVLQQVTIASNVQIGRQVIILPNSVISHDDTVGDYTCIAGGVCLSGGVQVGASCYLGTNSTIIENVKIGDYCLIAMGSVVLESVAGNSVVAGNPARFLRSTLTDPPRAGG